MLDEYRVQDLPREDEIRRISMAEAKEHYRPWTQCKFSKLDADIKITDETGVITIDSEDDVPSSSKSSGSLSVPSNSSHSLAVSATSSPTTISAQLNLSTMPGTMLEQECAKADRVVNTGAPCVAPQHGQSGQFITFDGKSRDIWIKILALARQLPDQQHENINRGEETIDSVRRLLDEQTKAYIQYHPASLEVQVERMVKVLRSRAFLENMMSSWTHGHALETAVDNSHKIMRELAADVQNMALRGQQFLVDRSQIVLSRHTTNLLTALESCIALQQDDMACKLVEKKLLSPEDAQELRRADREESLKRRREIQQTDKSSSME